MEVFMLPLETSLHQAHVHVAFGTIPMGPNQG
jgi:hypothetical protein